MIAYCKSRETKKLVGQVLKENSRMIHFVEHLGFKITGHPEPGVVEVTLPLEEGKIG